MINKTIYQIGPMINIFSNSNILQTVQHLQLFKCDIYVFGNLYFLSLILGSFWSQYMHFLQI